MPLVLVTKVIKPKRLNKDAMRLALLTALHASGSEIFKDFQKTTKTWKRKPKFVTQIGIKGGPTVLVGTDDPIYKYVDEGTKPHKIPRRPGGKPLYFQWGGKGSYHAKTRPRMIDSWAGFPAGPFRVFKSVQHPGTKARNFADEIQRRRQPWFKKRMEQAMRDAAKASGHGG